MKTIAFFAVNMGIMLLVFLVFLIPVARDLSEPGEGGIAFLILMVGVIVSTVVAYVLGGYICRQLNILPPKQKNEEK